MLKAQIKFSKKSGLQIKQNRKATGIYELAEHSIKGSNGGLIAWGSYQDQFSFDQMHCP